MPESTIDLPLQRQAHEPWSFWTRVSFRLAFLYWTIYIFPSPGSVSLLDLVLWLGDKMSVWLGWPMHAMAPWVGGRVFHLTGDAANWHKTTTGNAELNARGFHWVTEPPYNH